MAFLVLVVLLVLLDVLSLRYGADSRDTAPGAMPG